MQSEIQNLSIYLALGLATTAAVVSLPHDARVQVVQPNITQPPAVYFPEVATFDAAAGRPPEASAD